MGKGRGSERERAERGRGGEREKKWEEERGRKVGGGVDSG